MQRSDGAVQGHGLPRTYRPAPAPTASQNSVELLGVFGLHQADPRTGTHCHLAPPHNSRPAAAVVPLCMQRSGSSSRHREEKAEQNRLSRTDDQGQSSKVCLC